MSKRPTAQFGPVAPIQVLEGLYDFGPDMFGSYHLLLAHHTVAAESRGRFADLFSKISRENRFGDGELTIIMDNSIVELGDAVDAAMVADAVDIIEFNCPQARVYPVLPDVMGKGEETRNAIAAAYEEWVELIGGHGFMVVAQGETFADFQATLDYACSLPAVQWIGVPRILVSQIGTRAEATQAAIASGKCVHLLGFSDNMEDDIACARIPGVSGIDSAVPLRLQDVFTPYITTEKRDPNWFRDALVTPHMISNLVEARRYIEE